MECFTLSLELESGLLLLLHLLQASLESLICICLGVLGVLPAGAGLETLSLLLALLEDAGATLVGCCIFLPDHLLSSLLTDSLEL